MRLTNTSNHHELWAITSYFNPADYGRRLINYKHFRENLYVPLVAVELSYDGTWDLDDNDADILIRVEGHDVMWQKERLLNIALEHVPEYCASIAYLDCDIVFKNTCWASEAIELLDRHELVQLFRDVHYMKPEWKPGDDEVGMIICTRNSIAYGVASGLPVEDCMIHPGANHRPGTYNNGLAWCARRDVLEEHGFYDANIIGGGDRAMSCAAWGCYSHAIEWHVMCDRHRQHYLDWARPFHHSVRGEVSYLDSEICHLWHGSVKDRSLGSRHVRLASYNYDPYIDIVIDNQGCWSWASDKKGMHKYLENYFRSRNEDG